MPATLQDEIIQSIEDYVAEQLVFLKPVAQCWQPSDFLPDLAAENWKEEVSKLKNESAALPDDALVMLVGNLVTEEALPSYQTWLNRVTGLRDETGASMSAWGQWTRGWTAEENRHGEVLNKYLYLSGRVNMRSVEITTQHLIRNGFDLQSGNDDYKSLVYASFQERATKISHANTGRLAERHGDRTLGKICATIATDEARHEEAYKRIFGKLIEVDPTHAVIAFGQMMRQKIVMPARFMSDGTDRDLFAQFAVVAQRVGVYTVRDYADIIRHLAEYWNLAQISLSGEAAKEQEFICNLPQEYLSKAGKIERKIANFPQEPFEWIFGRSA